MATAQAVSGSLAPKIDRVDANNDRPKGDRYFFHVQKDLVEKIKSYFPQAVFIEDNDVAGMVRMFI